MIEVTREQLRIAAEQTKLLFDELKAAGFKRSEALTLVGYMLKRDKNDSL